MKKKRRLIEIEERDDVIFVRILEPEIFGEDDVNQFGDQVFDLVDKDGHHKIQLSLKGVTQTDSSFLGKLITLNKKARAIEGGKLVLCEVPAWFYEILEVTQLHKVFLVIKDDEPKDSKQL